MEAPNRVKRGILLQWVALLLSVIVTIVSLLPDSEREVADAVFWLIIAASYVVSGVVIHLAYRRRNWARWVLLIFCIVAVVLHFVFPPEASVEPLLETAISISLTAMEIVAVYLLFTGSSVAWYCSERQHAI